MKLHEKIEVLYESYTRTLDFEIACLRAGISEEERELVDADEMLQIRIALYDADQREELITNMRDLSRSNNESIKLNATRELGKMIYKERFNTDKKEESNFIPKTVVLVGKYPDDIKE